MKWGAPGKKCKSTLKLNDSNKIKGNNDVVRFITITDNSTARESKSTTE